MKTSRFLIIKALIALCFVANSLPTLQNTDLEPLGNMTIRGDFGAGNIDQLGTNPTYHIDIKLGKPTVVTTKKLFGRSTHTITDVPGTWFAYTGYSMKPTLIPGASGTVVCTLTSKNDLMMTFTVSDSATPVLILQKPYFKPEDFTGTGILFVRQGKQTLYFTQIGNVLKTFQKGTPPYITFDEYLKRLQAPGGVGIFKEVGEGFFKPLGGIDFMRLFKL